MKKLIIILSASLALYACGGNGTENPNSTPTTPAANPDYDKGLALVGQSDCLTCHKIEEKLTGPSYREIANKYANDSKAVDYLADKIQKGGSGVWGSVPMLAHPNLSEDDAKAMAKYILLLKK